MRAGSAVVVDNVGIAAAEVVDDAEDAFLVAGDDAGTEDDGVAGGDAGVLVVVDGGAAEGAHGLALGAADEDHDLLGGVVVDLAGWMMSEEGSRGSRGPGQSQRIPSMERPTMATLRPCWRASSQAMRMR